MDRCSYAGLRTGKYIEDERGITRQVLDRG